MKDDGGALKSSQAPRCQREDKYKIKDIIIHKVHYGVALEAGGFSGRRAMLTAEDLQAHERLIAALPKMAMEEIVDAYRRTRRTYEAQHWAGEDADHAEVCSEILGRELADRVAFGPDGLAASKRGGEGT